MKRQYTRKVTPATLTERELQEACRQWQSGGNLGLGSWAARNLTPWDYRAWGELVDVVRNELQDFADHS